jgi:hypothetical protein
MEGIEANNPLGTHLAANPIIEQNDGTIRAGMSRSSVRAFPLHLPRAAQAYATDGEQARASGCLLQWFGRFSAIRFGLCETSSETICFRTISNMRTISRHLEACERGGNCSGEPRYFDLTTN